MSGAPFRPLYRARHLSEPPRHLPYSLRARLRTGGALGIIGWAFLAIGSLAVWTFVPNSELITLMTFHGEKKTAMGVVIDVSSTSASENDRPVMKVTAEFSDGAGRRRRAQSYTMQTTPPENVTVEYLSGDPDAARIEGMRMRSAPAWVVVALIFPIVGGVFALRTWRRGGQAIKLLRVGVQGRGKRVHTRATSTSINDQIVFEYTFEFEVDGQTYNAKGETHGRELTDDALEPLLYDPSWPNNATMLDHLPGSPRIADDGEIHSSWSGGAVLALALALACPIINVVSVLTLLA